MMEIIGYAVGSFAVLYVIYVAVFYAKSKRDSIPKWLYYPIYGLATIGFIGDVLFNIVFGTFIFLQAPDFSGAHIKFMPTLTERLRDIIFDEWLTTNKSYRYRLAVFTCKYLLEPWDYGHCNLGRYLKDD